MSLLVVIILGSPLNNFKATVPNTCTHHIQKIFIIYIFSLVAFTPPPVGGVRMATCTLCRVITTDYLYNTM